MDIDDALEHDPSPWPVPPGDPGVPCAVASWRQHDAAAQAGGQHIGTPLADDAAAASDAAPQQALHDDELWLLARRAQGAALQLDFELRTPLVRQVFRRDFVYVSRQLYGLQASRRVQGLDRGCLDDALAAIEHRAQDVQVLLAGIHVELQAAIDARAPANARIAFAKPARFQATLVSPAAHRYLRLLMRADDTLAQLEMAWLLGLVAPATRTNLAADCRRALQGFKDFACDRRHAIGQLVREVNAQRRVGRAADRSCETGADREG